MQYQAQPAEGKAYLRQPFSVIWTLLLPPQAGRHKPEAHIDKLRLRGGMRKV